MITLEEARNKLPKDYKITDKELLALIADSYALANFVVNEYLRSKKDATNNDR